MSLIGVVEEISRRGAEEVSVEWRIPNFQSLLDGRGRCYNSPEFGIADERWRLDMRPKWQRETRNPASGWVWLCLYRRDRGPPATVHFSVGIRGSGGVEKSREGEKKFLGFDVRVWKNFCSRYELLQHRNRLMPDDTMIIQCVLKRPGAARVLISTGAAPSAIDNSVHVQQLLDDFSRLLKEAIEPDATLTCGGQTWRVHRSILSVRSDVFAAMFRSGMVESQTGTVRVEDLEASILDSLLQFIYSGKVPEMSGEDVSSLYEAGDRYALDGLRKACSDWMVGSLSVENCLSFLLTADAHGDADLKAAAVSFITEHFSQLECAVWKNFVKEHSTLAMEVLQRFAPSLKQ